MKMQGIISTSSLYGNNTDSSRSKQISGGFDLILDGVKTYSVSDNLTKDNSARSAKNQDNNTEVNQTAANRRSDSKEASKLESKKDIESSKQSSALDKAANKADDEKIDEKDLEKIAALVSVISETVMDKLGLNADEFNDLLNELNMTAMDLLDAEGLQKFVLAASGEEDVLALLTNENLLAVMNDLSSQINSLKNEAGLLDLDIDVLKQLLADADKAGKNLDLQELAADDNLDSTNSIEELALSNQTKAEDTTGRSISEEMTKDDSFEAIETTSINSSQESANEEAAGNETGKFGEQNSFQTFVDNMLNSVANSARIDESQSFLSNLREIAYQIVDRIRTSITPDQTTLEMNLTPESLGKVNLTIHSRDGVMTARFVVENELSKEAIESQLGLLRESLNQQGIKVEAIEVTVSAYAFAQNSSNAEENQSDSRKNNNSGRRITLEEAFSMSEEGPEAGISTGDELLNNQINYIA